MSWFLRRGSALLFLISSVVMIAFVIPDQTETGFYSVIQPGTMPAVAAALIGIGAFLALFEPTARDGPDYPRLARASLFVALLLGAAALVEVIGFKWTAPILALAVMLTAHERRWAWIVTGALIVPLIIWLVFDQLLGRPL